MQGNPLTNKKLMKARFDKAMKIVHKEVRDFKNDSTKASIIKKSNHSSLASF